MEDQNLPPTPSDDPNDNPDFPMPDEPTGPTVPDPPQPVDDPNPYPVTDVPIGDPSTPGGPTSIPPRIF